MGECKSRFRRVGGGGESFDHQVDYHLRITNQCFVFNGLGERFLDVESFVRRDLRQIKRGCPPLVLWFLLVVSV